MPSERDGTPGRQAVFSLKFTPPHTSPRRPRQRMNVPPKSKVAVAPSAVRQQLTRAPTQHPACTLGQAGGRTHIVCTVMPAKPDAAIAFNSPLRSSKILEHTCVVRESDRAAPQRGAAHTENRYIKTGWQAGAQSCVRCTEPSHPRQPAQRPHKHCTRVSAHAPMLPCVHTCSPRATQARRWLRS